MRRRCPIRRISSAVIVGTALAMVPHIASSQSQPRACVDQPPPLPESTDDKDVIYRLRSLKHREDSHPIKTFSETAQDPQGRFEQCFRYEIENVGPKEITHVWWPLADISAGLLKPGTADRRRSVRTGPIADDPIGTNTTVNAFENAKVETRAWAERLQANAAAKRAPGVAILRAPDIDAEFLGWLQQNKLPVVTIVALRPDSEGQGAPLRTSYSKTRFSLSSTSTARQAGPDVMIETTVTATGPDAGAAEYFMPALHALQGLDAPSVGLNEYSRFLSRYRESSTQSDRNQSARFTWRVPLNFLNNGQVYRMRHPVSVRFSDNSVDCVLVDSYSPLAMNFSLQDCPGENR